MGNRFGGVAGVVAMGAALALALVIALTNGRVDLERGTYVFTEPATDYVDENLVLVQDGFVTDVWISDADRENDYYGYTPTTPADAARLGDDGATVTREDDAIRQCWFVGTPDEHCTVFQGIEPLSAGRAARMSAWPGLADGSYYLEGVSVTWDTGSSSHATVTNGIITPETSDTSLAGIDTSSLPTEHGDWVRYWVHGADEPFALCHDDPRSMDEEACWTWTEATDAKGA